MSFGCKLGRRAERLPSLLLLSLLLALPLRGARAAALLWPAPQSLSLGAALLSVDPQAFAFAPTGAGAGSGLLRDALARYAALLFLRAPPTQRANVSLTPVVGALAALEVFVASADEALALATSERYSLSVRGDGGGARLEADTVFGAMRGLETFSQLVGFDAASGLFLARVAEVADAPRFAHRGALVDTSRHFEPVAALRAFLDAMAYNKLNVLHWHVVDDESFPFFSQTFPNLTAAGAYNAPATTHVYSRADVAGLVAYAKARGIRVVAEFDASRSCRRRLLPVAYGRAAVSMPWRKLTSPPPPTPLPRHPVRRRPATACRGGLASPACSRSATRTRAARRRPCRAPLGPSTRRSPRRGPSCAPSLSRLLRSSPMRTSTQGATRSITTAGPATRPLPRGWRRMACRATPRSRATTSSATLASSTRSARALSPASATGTQSRPTANPD